MAKILPPHNKPPTPPADSSLAVTDSLSALLGVSLLPIGTRGTVCSEDFQRWRPRYHLMAVRGWMNDPCGLGYNPASRLYHIAFKWNANGNDWGNISWGSATSSDLVKWDVSLTPYLELGTQYDRCGVFSGCLVQPGVTGKDDGMLTYFYTSASDSPIHYTLPYVYGSESLSTATSKDSGKTWQKHHNNPLLPGPPPGITVTGWRDPYVSSWPALSESLGIAADSVLFGCISGGIKGKGPTAFLYSIDGN
ncbi:glycosyl hydrolase [Talaromyces proteolyticus]|uniref:Glycosyl hydrolase n=1 Tax=Talaromyces proteolyticus TaxID=1131652 RepID=A0AAD4PWH6_9EURO|nr:glycosyl hydrolase [Talaromyces proteolyticus]KAH8691539.1 glycosyl hydrolase [Talaromyces proteolyticus]